MKKEYISPKVIAREVKLDNLLVDMSNGTDANPNYPGGSDAKRGSFEYEEEDF